MPPLPHPLPYQGSKRRLAPLILRYLPPDTATLVEPFAGSAALTLAAAHADRARRFLLGDALAPLAAFWQHVVDAPEPLADAYAAHWRAQAADPRGHYDSVRARFNRDPTPGDLLYLAARCVKNAVRFNAAGEFNQSPDRRRRGVAPETLRARLRAAHALLAGRTRVVAGDYAPLLAAAAADDVAYLDPPYLGTSAGRDRRYCAPLALDRFIAALAAANTRGTSYLVSFDGRSGARSYGPPLPDDLALFRCELHAGRSSQATLLGRAEETVESLYLSPALVARLARAGVTPRPTERLRAPTA